MKFLRRHSVYFLTAAMTALVLMLVYNRFSLYPFGVKTLSWGDLAQQNLPVLLQFKDVLEGRTGPFFSMANAGGMDFMSVFLFLASSPFSLLAVLVEKVEMINFVNIIVALKIIVCSVTACAFFRYYFKRLDAYITAALSVSYGFCGYSMMYYQLITWLDVMYMLPLFLIAFGHMIKKEKVIPYIITLSLMILFQFYLGYML
ncbi:MAG: YfhO family protein, partial [Oscillospiraceae bacterium]